jgi:Uma2 family endonuclease
MNQIARFKVDKRTFYEFVAKHDDERFEYEDGFIVQQMTGGTLDHSRITANFVACVSRRLSRSNWVVLPDRGVDTGATVRYPDVVVEPVGADPKSLSAMEPAIVVEVLSPSSLARDLSQKPSEYMSLPSLLAYIVASQDEAVCLAWVRENGRFPDEPVEFKRSDTIHVRSLALTIPLADVYEGVQPAG